MHISETEYRGVAKYGYLCVKLEVYVITVSLCRSLTSDIPDKAEYLYNPASW